MSFLASYPGVCAACDDRFPKDTEIEYDADGDIVHVDCPALRTATVREICPSCFCEVPVVGVCPCRE